MSSIDNIIKVLSVYEGKVFGEYVREVVVTRMKNPTCDVKFNSVDIWFKNKIDKDNFINRSGHFKKEIYFPKNIDLLGLEQYICFTPGGIPVKFNIFVGIWFPTYDFDVNTLTYFYLNGKPTIESNLLTTENKLDQIVKAINMKEANMNIEYFNNMVNHYLSYYERSKMINELYISRGWTIFCEGVKITSPFTGTCDDAIEKQKFVKNTLLERYRKDTIKIDVKQDINMSQWSPGRASNARDKNMFVSVGGSRISNRFLSGATRSWTSNDLDEQGRILNLELQEHHRISLQH